MGMPLDYRNAVPDLSSSSPLHCMNALSSSPPLSPQSPTPSRTLSIASRPNGLASPTSSNPHPFSGSAKANIHSHPRFGKDQLRSKHLRGSPDKAAAAGQSAWVLTAGPSMGSRLAPSSSSPFRNGGDKAKMIDDALEQHFFDSSDDNPSSDWNEPMDFTSTATASTAPSSLLNAAAPHVGLGIVPSASSTSVAHAELGSGRSASADQTLLGLGTPFQEPWASSSAGRSARVRTFSRTQSSSQDPFSAGAGSSLNLLEQSPRTQRKSQRRRITGSSPKKLTSAGSAFNNISSDESSDEGKPLWDEKMSDRPTGVNWDTVVEQVFEKVDGSIELTKRGLTRIDPIIADLSKFVSIPHLRKEETNTTNSSQFSRAPSYSSNSPFERSISSTSAFNSPTGRKRSGAYNVEPTFNSKVQMFLAGNRLQLFPSALFELHNLVVLTIRDNGLQELPAAIGQLTNLKELNVSQNELRFLPAEIQKLRLNSFVHFPNPFDLPPEDMPVQLRRVLGRDADTQTSEGRTATPAPMTSMGPPAVPLRSLSNSRLAARASFAMAGIQNDSGQGAASTSHSEIYLARCLPEEHVIAPRLPSLMEVCIRKLLEPEEESSGGGKILLEDFESGCLGNLNQSLDASIIRSLEAARRSAVKSWGRVRPASVEEGTWCSGAEAKDLFTAQRSKCEGDPSAKRRAFAAATSMFDFGEEASNEESTEEEEEERRDLVPSSLSIEEQLDRGDDCRLNPWFNRCPNPEHYTQEREAKRGASSPFDWPGLLSGGRIFAKPSVQRLEWVSHVAGVAVSQIRLDDVASRQEAKKPMMATEATLIPLQWRGCGPKCLRFLE